MRFAIGIGNTHRGPERSRVAVAGAVVLAVISATAACGVAANGHPDAASTDAGTDGARNDGVATDVRSQDVTVSPDTMPDAPALLDATDADTGVDAGDAGIDASARDAGFDAASRDASADAGTRDAAIRDTSIDAVTLDARVDGSVDSVSPADAGPASARQTARPLGSTTAPNGFYEYLPAGYGDGALRPLLVFWHGRDEGGNGTTDLSRVLRHGPPNLINADTWPASRPFIVLSPQNFSATSCVTASTIRNFITWALANYDIDTRRVYLTGLSCGSIGSWDYIQSQLDTVISAAVLLSGDPGNPDTSSTSAWQVAGCNLGRVAIWALHGDADTVVPIAHERVTMNDLLACPAPPRRDTRWTEIAGGGHTHTLWNSVYSGGTYDIYDFLLTNPHP